MKRRKIFLLPILPLLTSYSSDEPANRREKGNRIIFKAFVSPKGRGATAIPDVITNMQQNTNVFIYIYTGAGAHFGAEIPDGYHGSKIERH